MPNKNFQQHKKKGFTTYSNEIFYRNDIKALPKYLLMQMLSFSKNWQFSVEGLVKVNHEGRDSIMMALKVLEEHGYLYRERIRENGQLKGTKYHVYEDPTDNPFIILSPKSENPTLVNPTLEKTTQYNKKTIKEKINKEERESGLESFALEYAEKNPRVTNITGYANKLLKDWNKNKITTMADAKEFVQWDKCLKKWDKGNRKAIRVEQKPDWFDKPQEQPQTTTSDDDLKKVEEMKRRQAEVLGRLK